MFLTWSRPHGKHFLRILLLEKTLLPLLMQLCCNKDLKISCKTFLRKTSFTQIREISLPHFVQDSLKKHIFISNWPQGPENSNFSVVLSIWKAYFLKLLFRAIELTQELNLIHFELFLILASSPNLVPKIVQIATRLYEMLCVIWYHSCNLKNVKNSHGGVLLFEKLQALA